jgi:hypothetical protein
VFEILLVLLGFYIGGSFVTSVVTQTIDGVPARFRDKFILAFLWPLALYEASQYDDEEEN